MFFLAAVYNAFEEILYIRSSGISGLAHIALLLAPSGFVTIAGCAPYFLSSVHIALHPKHPIGMATGKKSTTPGETSTFVYPVHILSSTASSYKLLTWRITGYDKFMMHSFVQVGHFCQPT